ncbi:PTS system mannose/fructose/N-acetylgalactosamine-transporter subunit IIB [[Clostridium] dakarense]|uniref:PTS system mannose/fructose/N-acetylgalactosamine-transporter subunit IIB n=1 Tax=Faecalimicrobium dakarense TaxID=1301100 RepID=UPI0004BB4FB3|nr:PTS system mannose/fructose/N-acetylgalactosamine-transporter subunit IIB [[Clostridium] dakarense]
MGVPDIKMMRIDERLIHGQGQMWLSALGANLVIVADDEASTNKMQQTLMKTVVPASVGMRFFSIAKTCEIIHKAAPHQKIFIVCKSPESALKLVDGGVPIKEINIGNIHNQDGKEKITRSIYLGEDDKNALRTLRDKYSVKFNTKTTPIGGDGAVEVDINNYL